MEKVGKGKFPGKIAQTKFGKILAKDKIILKVTRRFSKILVSGDDQNKQEKKALTHVRQEIYLQKRKWEIYWKIWKLT